jgi:hypothetical protein
MFVKFAVLVAFVRGKRCVSESEMECLEDGSQHLKLFDAIKKEFKVRSKFYTSHSIEKKFNLY